MNTIALVFIGGGIGSVGRYLVMQLVNRWNAGGSFPWHTLTVNIIGALVIGMLVELLALRMSLPAPSRFFLVTGILGGFTTFSSFSMETALLLERGDYLNGMLYVLASVMITVLAVFAGIALIRVFS